MTAVAPWSKSLVRKPKTGIFARCAGSAMLAKAAVVWVDPPWQTASTFCASSASVASATSAVVLEASERHELEAIRRRGGRDTVSAVDRVHLGRDEERAEPPGGGQALADERQHVLVG